MNPNAERERKEEEGGASAAAQRHLGAHGGSPTTPVTVASQNSQRERGRSSKKEKRGERKWRLSGGGNGDDGESLRWARVWQPPEGPRRLGTRGLGFRNPQHHQHPPQPIKTIDHHHHHGQSA